MKTTALIKLAASTLILGATMVGCSPSTQAGHLANASDTKTGKVAMKAANAANTALVARDFATAVPQAEIAVAAMPRDAGFRMMLGQAYLGAGRLASAETAFSETLTLMPDHGRAALNLALVQIAEGKSEAALTTLADYHDKIGASDYGLALALAGNVDGGIKELEGAVREPRANAKSRQNLALAYALAGKWSQAHVTAAQDLAPADADARIIQWAEFVKPDNAPNRVASLLGVHPVQDAGQPTRLALAPTAENATQVAEAAPVAAPVQVAAAIPVVDTPAAAFETASATTVAPSFGVQTVDVPASTKWVVPTRQRIVPAQRRTVVSSATPARAVESGKFVVQLGAFENVAVSKDAWNRVAPRFGLRNYEPANSNAQVRGANFVRLAVGGFETRAGAVLLCTRIKAQGGKCFVRGLLSDKPAEWVQRGMPKPVRMASR
ncbi:MAG: hypothetical protein JWL66_2771 [Sphingomonadales bacterium]|nr:hypothetical protein [Sphingomonadales bacterium]